MILPLPLLLISLLAFSTAKPARRHYDSHTYFVMEHDRRAGATLEEVARALGVEVIERAGELPDHWLVRSAKEHKRDATLALHGLRSRAALADSGFSPRALERTHDARRISQSVKFFERQVPRQRVKRDINLLVRQGQNFNESSSSSVAEHFGFLDPEFPRQWHLVNDELPEHSMNATGLWAMGITGQGIVSALVDDGLDYTSDDLAENFDALGSYDFNDHVDLPTPVLADDHHGTRCAGQIAAVKNDVCGIGVAYDSKVAGIRILSGPISDIDEAASLNYGFNKTSIYSCSWGPSDDGRSMEAPGYLVEKAVVNGINNGRDKKGSIFVFASGNGAGWGDQCNFDGYTNSIYSITVAAVDFKGLHPSYSEACAANMVVAYSSGSGNHITTTDVGKNRCSGSHGGTSAAAPNAVGVFALALSVRPDLTWRDMQHICVQTAVHINPTDPDWETTAAGRPFSYKYGFGKLDAYHYVTAAQNWKNVKPQTRAILDPVQLNNGTMNLQDEMSGGEPIIPGGVKSSLVVTQAILDEHNFEKLEHITVKVWIQHTKRGDVEVELVSPNGVKSVLAAKRVRDTAVTGYPGWRFMTIKHWDENPLGEWTIRVSDQSDAGNTGAFLGWSMTLWGSAVDASKAVEYGVALLDNVFPPLPSEESENHPAATSSTLAAATSTKSHPKPTAGLPGDHGEAEGENHQPAFPSASSTTVPTMTPTPDEGWFSDMASLVTNQVWLVGAVGAVLIFAIAVGIYFCRRRILRRRAYYSALGGGDDLAMGSVREGRTGGPRTKELYDAFGDVSDDEDADEETGLRGGRRQDRTPGALGFHDGFLDDDEPSPAPRYRDEPSSAEPGPSPSSDRLHPREQSRSTADGTDSPDGSWEDASEPR